MKCSESDESVVNKSMIFHTLKKLLYKIWAGFLTVFGDIKISRWPMFINYDPYEYKMTGRNIRDVLRVIEPGFVVLRGYDNYADGYFITARRSYSHAGVYIGNGQIIHAVAPNVRQDDIIDFCRCDRIAILKPRKYHRTAIKKAKEFLKNMVGYDFCFTHGKETLYCFELAYECYDKLNITRTDKSMFFGLLKKNVVLSDNLLDSPDMELVYEFNPKYGIDFVAEKP